MALSPLSAVALELVDARAGGGLPPPPAARGAPTDAAAFIRGVGAAEPPPLGRPAAVRDAPSPPAPVHPPTPAEAAASSGGGGGGSPRRSLLRVVEGETEDSVLRFLVGGLAGATAKTIIAPLDRVKIIFQISHKPFSLRSVWNELVTTARTQGAAALFRGNAAQILRVYPYSGIQLMAFDQYTRLLLVEKRAGEASRGHAPPSHVVQGASASAQLGPLERMLAGSAAGATSVAATYPLDCLRARLAVQQELAVPGARYKGMWHAVRSMSSESGVLSLYRGMAPTLLGILPYAGISFATYETLKQYSVEANWGEGGHVPNWQRLLFGGVGGLAGQASTYPLDIVRRRMQTDGYTPLHAHAQPPPARAPGAPLPTPAARGVLAVFNSLRARGRAGGMLDVLGRIVDREGAPGLFKGLSMNAVKGPIAVGVSFTTYDTLKRALNLEGAGGEARG